ncbi:MAG: response regulator [bacterium]
MSELEPKKILLVEDELNLRELVRGRLEANGYEVTVAEDGYKALKAAHEYRPDLIILDLMLPKMDGYTVCRVLRSSGGEAQVPVILFSARSSEDDRRRGIESGANAYVTKPFDPPLLLDKIRELLDPEGWAAEHPAAAPATESAGDAEPPTATTPAAPVKTNHAPRVSGPPPVRPEPEQPLTPEELAARARPTAPPAAQPAAPEPVAQPEPPVTDTPAEASGGGFFARLFSRLFGSRSRQ